MQRYIEQHIVRDLNDKIILLMGPRQSGKTTLSKQITDSFEYLNMDNNEHMVNITKKFWDRNKELLILDEFHKFANWKRFIKGVYDTEGLNPKILITGSAQLNTFKNVGDSLAGRYFSFRLYPIDIFEACNQLGFDKLDAFTRLITCGGFPEPFLKGEKNYYNRWYKTHNEIMLRQDLIDLTAIKNITTVTMLAEMLKQRIGGNINYANLASDLHVNPGSVKNWLDILENMYMFFKITPYHNNIARSLLKEPKIYCYDIGLVKDSAAQLENLVALSLLKYLHFLEDTKGYEVALHDCRTKDGREIDFLAKVNNNIYLLEVKTSEDKLSKHFSYFNKFFEKAKCIQLVKNLTRPYQSPEGFMVCDLVDWLANIDKNLL